ncbi:MAG: hypothetical protein AAGJ19_01340 [Myxococcota bacterium]
MDSVYFLSIADFNVTDFLTVEHCGGIGSEELCDFFGPDIATEFILTSENEWAPVTPPSLCPL